MFKFGQPVLWQGGLPGPLHCFAEQIIVQKLYLNSEVVSMPSRLEIPPKNNMDLLRVIFGLIVVFAHIYALTKSKNLLCLKNMFDGELAVRCFFVVSGFLIFMSYEKSKSNISYLEKRIRRIYPAYFCVVVSAAIFGAFLTKLPIGDYFGMGLLKYLIFNLSFLNSITPSLPGVFVNDPTTPVNGALWTIKVEMGFYIVVPLLVWLMNRFSRLGVILTLYALSLTWRILFDHFASSTGQSIYLEIGKQLPGQLSFFLSGAAIYYCFPWFMRSLKWLFPAALVGAVLAQHFSIAPMLPACLAIVVMAIAFGPYLGNAGKYGDISYGIYIYHYPIIQTVIFFGLFDQHSWAALVLVLIISTSISFISWHFVEKPFLQKTSHYRVMETAGLPFDDRYVNEAYGSASSIQPATDDN